MVRGSNLSPPRRLADALRVEPRSLVYLCQSSLFFRYIWKHGITPRHSDIIPNHILNQDNTHEDNNSGGPSKEGDVANTEDDQAVNENSGGDDKGIEIIYIDGLFVKLKAGI